MFDLGVMTDTGVHVPKEDAKAVTSGVMPGVSATHLGGHCVIISTGKGLVYNEAVLGENSLVELPGRRKY